MENTTDELLQLQHLYQQDTLYLVPEKTPLASQPLPPLAALVKEAEKLVSEAEVQTAETTAPTEVMPASPPTIVWQGEALKGTYLLFSVPETEFEALPEHVFLKKVLKAVGLESLEVKFGNLPLSEIHNVKELARDVMAKHILVFGGGVPIENLEKLEPYRMYKLDETRFVRVDALADIEQDTGLKAKLWEVLQKIFLQQ